MKILHLSDLHFGFEKAETAKAIQKNYLSTLKDTLTGIANTEQIDYIFCTGDLTWKGEEDHFKQAEEFIRELLTVFKLNPDHLFMCPGNHDVDRRELEHWQFPDSQQEANVHLCPEKLDLLTRNFLQYTKFCERLGAPKYSLANTTSYLTGVLSNDDFNIICLNSAWYAKSKEVADKMWIGSNFLQVIKASNTIDDAKPTIAIVHHPNDKWHEDETHNFPDKINVLDLLCEMSDLILSGHTHEIKCRLSNINGAFLTGTGALYNDSTYQNSFYLYDITATAQNRVHYYIINGEWKTDAPEKLGWGKLREKLSPKHEPESKIEKLTPFDKTISAISHKSVDTFALKAFRFEKHDNSPIYHYKSAQKKQVVKSLEPFIVPSEGTGRYDQLLDSVLKQIGNNENIVLQGMQGTGKSSFMSLLFIDILNKFRNEGTGVYPVYIDIHYYLKRDTFDSAEELRNDVVIIKKAMNSNANVKWVIFIDGIDEFESSSAIYEEIALSLLDEENRIVLCVGMAEDIQAIRKRSEMGELSSKLSDFRCFAVLQSIKENEALIRKNLSYFGSVYDHELSISQCTTIIKWIKTYCNGFIDFRTLLTFFLIATEDKNIEKETLTKKLIAYHMPLVGNSEKALLDVAGVAASYITSDLLLRNIREINNKQSGKNFDNVIHRNKVVRDFLLAYYWAQYVSSATGSEPGGKTELKSLVEQDKNAGKTKNTKSNARVRPIKNAKSVQKQISKWNTIFPRTVNRFIIDLLDQADEQSYTANLMAMYEEASTEMKVNIAYFLGRSSDQNVQLFLRTQWDKLFKNSQQAKPMSVIDFRLLRSLSISLICAKDKTVESEFLNMLIESPHYAKWNMFMHCAYYFDKCEYSVKDSSKVLGEEITPEEMAEMFISAFRGMKNDLNNVFENNNSSSRGSKRSLKLDVVTFFSMCFFSSNFSQNEERIKAAKKIETSVGKSTLPKNIKTYARNCIYACELTLK